MAFLLLWSAICVDLVVVPAIATGPQPTTTIAMSIYSDYRGPHNHTDPRGSIDDGTDISVTFCSKLVKIAW